MDRAPASLVRLALSFFSVRNWVVYVGLVVIPAGLLYAAVLLTFVENGFTVLQVLRDPAQQSNESSFIGVLSNLGVALWVASASVSAFGFYLAWRLCRLQSSVPAASPAARQLPVHWWALPLLMTLLSTMLAIDDFFMIHDRYINQRVCYLVYAILAFTILLAGLPQIARFAALPFSGAMALLAASAGTDLIQYFIPASYATTQIFEEGFKFVGAASWLACSVILATALVRICTGFGLETPPTINSSSRAQPESPG